jgi:hypothetical protein
MTASRSLPARPSLDSLRKQAKKLARDRAISLRDGQLALAREYGYAGWQDLVAEVSKRVGSGLAWAVAQAERFIHDNDTERLKQLLAEYPALLSWQADKEGRGLIGMATGAYGDAGDPQREEWFTRRACAELLIDAGAVVAPSVSDDILQSRARGLLDLFQRKGLLPRTLKFFAALGDLDAVRTALDEHGNDASVDSVLPLTSEAFVRACLFHHEAVALLLLDRAITLDPELGEEVDGRVGRLAFVKSFIDTQPENVREIAGQATTVGLWKVFVMKRVTEAVHARDLTAFVSELQREPWLLGDEFVEFQGGVIGTAALNEGLEQFVSALLDFDPAILRRQPPPPSQNIEQVLTYGTTHLLPLLPRIWPIPDDLAHAAGLGDLSRVERWFDAEGKPALGDLAHQTPATSRWRPWNDVGVQQVLDTALAFAVINRHFEVADFLLAHGANVSTDWNSHEPASILHHLVFLPDPYERMQFLIDRGIDLTIKDYRWGSTAAGWARYALRDEKMAQWLEDAERQRERRRELGDG